MLKKAGIVVAAAAAGLLAVSPLAFAGDKDDRHDGHRGHDKVEIEDVNKVDESSEGLINVADNNINVPIQACNTNIEVVSIIDDVAGALALLGSANAEANDETVCAQDAAAGDEIELEND